jgi:hypothetical protein
MSVRIMDEMDNTDDGAANGGAGVLGNRSAAR